MEPALRGIIFSGDNPKLILEGRKTQTRRIVKPQPEADWKPLGIGVYNPATVAKDGEEYPGKEVFGMWDEDSGFPCPYGIAGDRLYVREKCWIDAKPVPQLGHRRVFFDDSRLVIHENGTRGESPHPPLAFVGNWKQTSIKRVPSIHMPRWASRITLEITKVRVERLQDISEEDAKAEGLKSSAIRSAKFAYHDLWDSLHGKGAWRKNPWVWVIGFVLTV